jgi:hypothetical protein
VNQWFALSTDVGSSLSLHFLRPRRLRGFTGAISWLSRTSRSYDSQFHRDSNVDTYVLSFHAPLLLSDRAKTAKEVGI